MQVPGAYQGAIALKTEGIDRARVPLLDQELFPFLHVEQAPCLVVRTARDMHSHRVEVNCVHYIVVLAYVYGFLIFTVVRVQTPQLDLGVSRCCG